MIGPEQDDTAGWAFIAAAMALLLAAGALGMAVALAKLRRWL